MIGNAPTSNVATFGLPSRGERPACIACLLSHRGGCPHVRCPIMASHSSFWIDGVRLVVHDCASEAAKHLELWLWAFTRCVEYGLQLHREGCSCKSPIEQQVPVCAQEIPHRPTHLVLLSYSPIAPFILSLPFMKACTMDTVIAKRTVNICPAQLQAESGAMEVIPQKLQHHDQTLG